MTDDYTSRDWRRSPAYLSLEQTAPGLAWLSSVRARGKVPSFPCCLSPAGRLHLSALGWHTREDGRAHSGNESRSGFLSTSAQLGAGSCTTLQQLNAAVSTKRRHAVKSGGVRPAGKERSGQPTGPWHPGQTRRRRRRRRSSSLTLTLTNPDREASVASAAPAPAAADAPWPLHPGPCPPALGQTQAPTRFRAEPGRRGLDRHCRVHFS